jgi:hypothetical protein
MKLNNKAHTRARVFVIMKTEFITNKMMAINNDEQIDQKWSNSR